MRKYIKEILYRLIKPILISAFKLTKPPRILRFGLRLNADILRAFGAEIGENNVRILSPITLHEANQGYSNLTIRDGCILNGNNYLDLSARITLEEGVSLGPGVIIMTHNRYNFNRFLEENLMHTCGKKDVLIRKGAGIKAGAVIVMGTIVGENAVVAAGAVVNRNVEDNCLVGGVPATLIKKIGDS
jgi:hypothetical protein